MKLTLIQNKSRAGFWAILALFLVFSFGGASLTANASPYVALGIATGGESLTAQILISAATQATLAGGETYNHLE